MEFKAAAVKIFQRRLLPEQYSNILNNDMQILIFLNNAPTFVFLNDIPTLLQSLYFSRKDKSPIAEKVMGSLFDIWFLACLRISKESLQEWNLKYLVDFQFVNISNMSISNMCQYIQGALLWSHQCSQLTVRAKERATDSILIYSIKYPISQ